MSAAKPVRSRNGPRQIRRGGPMCPPQDRHALGTFGGAHTGAPLQICALAHQQPVGRIDRSATRQPRRGGPMCPPQRPRCGDGLRGAHTGAPLQTPTDLVRIMSFTGSTTFATTGAPRQGPTHLVRIMPRRWAALQKRHSPMDRVLFSPQQTNPSTSPTVFIPPRRP